MPHKVLDFDANFMPHKILMPHKVLDFDANFMPHKILMPHNDINLKLSSLENFELISIFRFS